MAYCFFIPNLKSLPVTLDYSISRHLLLIPASDKLKFKL